MRRCMKCGIYLFIISVGGFFLGRIVPKKFIFWDRFPFRSFPFEREGKIYESLGIRKWKDRVFDMRRIFPNLIPPRTVNRRMGKEDMRILLKESCVAEGIHGILILAGFGCLSIWKGLGGLVISFLYGLGNIPFILIQRYNRPRMLHLWERQMKREGSERRTVHAL